MPKVHVDSDEWYPVYSFYEDRDYGVEVEVSQETLDRWNQTVVAFAQMQKEMQSLTEEAYRKMGIIK